MLAKIKVVCCTVFVALYYYQCLLTWKPVNKTDNESAYQIPVAQMVQHGASNAKAMAGSVSRRVHTMMKCESWMLVDLSKSVYQMHKSVKVLCHIYTENVLLKCHSCLHTLLPLKYGINACTKQLQLYNLILRAYVGLVLCSVLHWILSRHKAAFFA